ncbi:ABC transporter substrate-binding protein [Aestuariicella sp. G3-2]|uniref:MlaC/ttg2D family ABC transporter substrate-binding protein n=1 Tax=Pseudomaricurvus albidus TaxID=2842452 RepID=UPI001C0B7EA8|nr:ABC transporter substrate-binding protein [Aestuariicella albida]MBU3071277.1 ABC transporter substrate-binding protein [Aestuariicella albida]
MPIAKVQILRIFFALASLILTVLVHANTIPRNDPEKMLVQATNELLNLSREARDYAKQDPQRYYDEVAGIIGQVIDKNYFARGVMATYASQRLYRSLPTDAEKTAFNARITRFADTLQAVLIEKYADALLTFGGERIDVQNITSSGSPDTKVSLLQTIYDKNNKTYNVQYNLQKKSDGLWLINNVIVEGINMGATYRNQFSEAVDKHQGDVDYVVDHWGELMNNPQKSTEKNDAQ